MLRLYCYLMHTKSHPPTHPSSLYYMHAIVVYLCCKIVYPTVCIVHGQRLDSIYHMTTHQPAHLLYHYYGIILYCTDLDQPSPSWIPDVMIHVLWAHHEMYTLHTCTLLYVVHFLHALHHLCNFIIHIDGRTGVVTLPKY